MGSVERKALPVRIIQSEHKSQIFYMKMSISDGEKRGLLRGEKEKYFREAPVSPTGIVYFSSTVQEEFPSY